MNQVIQIEKFVKHTYVHFGINKHREITRLLYEISQKEHKNYRTIAGDIPLELVRFPDIKQYLLKRRFPKAADERCLQDFRFPQVSIHSGYQVKIRKRFRFNPGTIHTERDVTESLLAQRLRKEFPQARHHVISSYKDYIKEGKFDIRDYNQRSEKLFVVKERFQFFLSCPCSPRSVSCDYSICNLGFGCPFECVYCFLQGYTNAPEKIFI